ELSRLVAEQVFGLDVADAIDARLAVAQLVGGGHSEHGQAGGGGEFERAAPRPLLSFTASRGPSTGSPAMRAPCFTGSSSSRPSTIQPCWWMPATSRRAASPAPSTMARLISASLPVMRERACS